MKFNKFAKASKELIIVGIILGILVFFNYSNLFAISGYDYERQINFLGYNATIYSTQPFEGLTHSRTKICGNTVHETGSYVISTTQNKLSLSTSASIDTDSGGYDGPYYSGDAVIQINDLNIKKDSLKKMTIIYSQEAFIDNRDANHPTKGLPSYIQIGNTILFTSDTPKTYGPGNVQKVGELIITKLSDGQFKLADGTESSFIDFEDNDKLQMKVSVALGRRPLGGSSSSSLQITSIVVEYEVYNIVGGQCIVITKDYKSLSSEDYLNLESCQSNLDVDENNTVIIYQNVTINQTINQTVTLNQTCENGLSCPGGFKCISGVCVQEIEEPTFFEKYGLAGLILLIMGSIVIFLVMRGKR